MRRRDASTSPRFDKAESGAKALGELPQWDLSVFYKGPDDARIAADRKAALEEAARFAERYETKLGALAEAGDALALAEAIEAFDALQDKAGRLGSYASLLYAEDSTIPAHAKLYADIQGWSSDMAAKLLFFTLELNAIEEEKLAVLCAREPRLARYRPFLRDLALERPYELAADMERLLTEKSVTGRAAWNRLFDESMARLRVELDGEKVSLNEALDKLSEPDEKLREKAGKAIAASFAEEVPLYTLITNTLAKDKEIEDRWRGFEDVAMSRHVANRVEAPVVDALQSAVQASYSDISHRYYALKAKWMGKERLNFWDRNAPLPEDDNKLVSWDEARETVLSAYEGFDPEMARLAGEFFERQWIHAPARRGKAPGAFSHPTVPSAHPFVLLNYMGRPRDVMTLAHELGHGVHQVLAADQGPLLSDTPLTLAETASVFGEMLTFRRLLANAKDASQRRVLLASKIEDMINTAIRQIAFYTFERRVHEARRGGELTSEDLGRIWMEVQGESLGPAIHLDAEYQTFWCYIPHFIHAPFYVYAYAFGECLVNSLYAAYEATPDGFAQKYFDVLRAGGTLRHKELLAPFGLDASDPAFWDKGLSVIRGLIDELEADL
jgi:oligoendopeptidase F